MTEQGRSYDLLEITATVYEIGARAWVNRGRGDGDYYFEHDMVILPEPLRIYDEWNKRKFETSTEHYPEYGLVKDRSFITKIPFIGLNFRHISEGGFNPDHHERMSALDCDIADMGIDVYINFLPEIMQEIDSEIDNILPRLPLKDMWKEETKRFVFRFVVAIEHIYEKYYVWDAWAYEYDQIISWMGRVNVRTMCKMIDTPADESEDAS
jgi:hypothetical protein